MLKPSLCLIGCLICIPLAQADLPDKEKLERLKEGLTREVMKNEMRWRNAGGKCLDVGGDINTAGTNVHIWDCNDAPNQKWRTDDQQRLVNNGGKCLDVNGDINAAGTNVHIWDCNDAPNQKWRVRGERLVNEGGKCLDVAGDIKATGTNVQIWDCNDAPNQKWRFGQ